MDLNTEKVVSAMKMIDLDAEVLIKKAMVALVFKIDSSNINIVITLINQDTIVLFQIIVLVSKIQYLRTVIFLLVSRLINFIIKE